MKAQNIHARHKHEFMIISIAAFALAIINFSQAHIHATNGGHIPDYLRLIPHILVTHSLMPLLSLLIFMISEKWRLTRKHILHHIVVSILLSVCITFLVAIIDFLFLYWNRWNWLSDVIAFHFTHYFNFIILIYWAILLLAGWFDRKKEFNVRETSQEPVATVSSNNHEEKVYMERISVKHKDSTLFILVDEITWIQAADNYVKIFVDKTFFMERMTLKEINKLLNPSFFRQVHRSAIISISRIQSVQHLPTGSKVVKMQGGHSVSVTKKYRDEIRDLFTKSRS
jgi:hypothetical protein